MDIVVSDFRFIADVCFRRKVIVQQKVFLFIFYTKASFTFFFNNDKKNQEFPSHIKKENKSILISDEFSS